MKSKVKKSILLFYLLSLVYILSYVYFKIAEVHYFEFYAQILVANGIKLYGQLFAVIIYFIIATYIVIAISANPKENIVSEIFWIDIPAILILTYPYWAYVLNSKVIKWGESQFWQIVKSYWLEPQTSEIMLRVGSILIGMEIYRYIKYFKNKNNSK